MVLESVSMCPFRVSILSSMVSLIDRVARVASSFYCFSNKLSAEEIFQRTIGSILLVALSLLFYSEPLMYASSNSSISRAYMLSLLVAPSIKLAFLD
jgi:hypothetical protein